MIYMEKRQNQRMNFRAGRPVVENSQEYQDKNINKKLRNVGDRSISSKDIMDPEK